MSDSELSPFTENKTNRMVWIVPSVLLHAILLVVWLLMPEKPPREPSERKLTINREQAERLQQHVEDANLVVLREKVSELQTIKKAMADIREKKMEQLRGFETERVRQAPLDAAAVFNRFLASQNTLITSYQELLKTIRQAEVLTPAPENVQTGEGLGAAISILPDLQVLRSQALSIVQTLNQETSQTFVLLNTGETQLEWVQDPAIATELEDLKTAMEGAREMKDRIAKSVEDAYGAEWAMSEMLERADDYVESLKRYENHLEQGASDLEEKRRVLTESIGDREKELEDLQARLLETRDELKAPDADKGKLNQLVRDLQKTIEKQKKELAGEKRELGRLKFVPEKWQVDKAKSIRRVLGSLFKGAPEIGPIPEAIKAQGEVTRTVGALLEAIAKSSTVPAAGGAK